MGRLKDLIRKVASKSFNQSNKKTQEILNKMFPNHNLDVSSMRKGAPTKFNPPTKSRRTKARRKR